MNYLEIDDQLRELIKTLLNQGYKQTSIGRVLLGPNGYAPLSKFLDETSGHNFGIKPLSKIGELLGYDLKLVYVDNNVDHQINNTISEKNKDFFIKLQDGLISYLNDTKMIGSMGQRKDLGKGTALDQVLEKLLEE